MSSNKKTLIDGDFQVGSNHLTVDTSNNYVGFNTATPQNKIDVQIGARTGTHSIDKPLYVTGVTSTSGAEFVSDDGTAGIGIGSSNIFTTETNQNLTITPDGTGAVGIKTATPNPSGETFDLWVQGDTKVTGNVTAGTFFGDGSGLTNIISSQWDSSLEDIYFLNNSGSGSGRVAIGTTTPVSVLTLEGDSGGAPPTTGQEGTSNALVRVRDDNNVTLDIGTSSGNVWLQSSDATAMGTNYPVSINPNGGNVGVGTISPGAPLEVNKSSGGEILRLTTSTGTLYAGVDADPPWFGTSSNDHLRLMTNGSEKIRIESGGNVGVNTVAPLANLHVTGNTYVTSNLRVGSEILMDEKVATFGTTKTFTVTVSGGVYYIDGVQQPSIELHERQTYIFDMSDSTNSGHPLAFSTAYNGATSDYSTGVVSNHSTVPSGTTGSKVTFTVPVGAPSAFYYYCTVHGAGMGSSTASSIASTAELIVSGRVVASGNVEASNFIGGGTELTGVALETELASNVLRIATLEAANTVQSNLITAIEADIVTLEAANTVQSNLITTLTTDMTSNALRVTNIENNVLVSNSSGITTGFTRGDIIYASADNTLNKLPLGTANQVLKSDGTDVVWGTDGGASASTVWLENGNKIYYNTDNVGIGTSTPAFKLDVHGTANVGALTATTLSVGGAAVALDADMTSNAARVDALYTATTGDIIVATGTDTLGKLGIGSSGQVLKVASSGTSLEWTSDLTGGGGSGGGQWTGTTEIYFEGNVGISNTDPGHDLSVGSNLYVDDDGSNVLVIDGNLTAESMTLGGIGIVPSYPLSSVTDTGNTTPHTIEFTNAETGIVVSSNIVVTGNVTAAYLYGDVSNVTGIASNLQQIVENGNVTSNTVQFSNATTGIVTTANVEIGGELTVTGNVEVGTANLFVDTVNSRVGIGTTTPGSALDVVGDAAISSNLAVSGSKFTYDNTRTTVFTGTTTAAANEIGYLDMSTSSGSNNIHVKVYIKYGNGGGLGDAEYSFYTRPNAANYSLIYDYRNQLGPITPVVYRTNATDLYSGGTPGVVRFGYSIASAQNVIWRVEVQQRSGNVTFYPTNTGSAMVTTDLVQVTPAPFTRFDSNVNVGDGDLFVDTVSGNVGIGDSDPESILHVQSDVQSGAGGPIKKTSATAATSGYNYILNAPRPGTTSAGAVFFINGSTRTNDGDTNTLTIRNDSGSMDIGNRAETLVSSHTPTPETYNASQKNVDILLNNGSIWMSPYTGRHRNLGTGTGDWSQYVGKHYLGRILSGLEIENKNTNSAGATGYYSNLLHFRAHDYGIYGGSVGDRTMTIRGDKVGIRTQAPTYTMHVNGSLFYSSGGLNGGSDDRIKYNEENITNALDIIDKLTPQKYEKIMTFPSNAKGTWIPTDENWDTVKNAETKPWEGFQYGDEFGFIAQDVRNIPEVSFLVSGSESITGDENISPEEYNELNDEERSNYTQKFIYESNVVTLEEYTSLTIENRENYTELYSKRVETQTPLGLNYQGIFVVAVKAIQELKSENETLKTQLTSVLTRLDALENAS